MARAHPLGRIGVPDDIASRRAVPALGRVVVADGRSARRRRRRGRQRAGLISPGPAPVRGPPRCGHRATGRQPRRFLQPVVDQADAGDAFRDVRRDVVHLGRHDAVQQRDAVEHLDVQSVGAPGALVVRERVAQPASVFTSSRSAPPGSAACTARSPKPAHSKSSSRFRHANAAIAEALSRNRERWIMVDILPRADACLPSCPRRLCRRSESGGADQRYAAGDRERRDRGVADGSEVDGVGGAQPLHEHPAVLAAPDP